METGVRVQHVRGNRLCYGGPVPALHCDTRGSNNSDRPRYTHFTPRTHTHPQPHTPHVRVPRFALALCGARAV